MSTHPELGIGISRRHLLRTGVGSGAVLLLGACAPPTPPAGPAPTTAAVPVTAAAPTTAAVPKVASPTAAATAAPKPSLANIRLLFNVTADPTFIPDYITFDRLKDQYGIEVDRQQVSGADISIKSLVAGQVDVALSSLASGILAVGQGQTIRAVVPEGSAPYFTLVVTEDIKEWKDLEGKAIGITATSDGSYWTTVLQLRKHGIDPKAINWVSVRGTPARVDAMRAGKISAAQLQIGGALSLLEEPRFKRFAEIGRDFPNMLFSAFWASQAFINQHPDVLTALAISEMQSHRDVQDKAVYMPAAKKVLTDKMDEATISTAYDIVKGMNIWDPNETRWNPEAGDFTARTLAEFEAIEKYVPFSDWATTRFVEAARLKLGPYSG
jgi:ABC-type nitrate/sulfonate/bicarbonate transport system substrate-binding protein